MPHIAKITDSITVEYELKPRMVVFSHGFGVKRDSRGMFTDIVRHLPEGFGYVLFDYYDIDEAHNSVRLTDFAEQVTRLQTVLEWTLKQPRVEDVGMIAHSMGCIVAALTAIRGLSHVVLLASPTSIGERTRKYFTSKEGAKKQGDTWIVPRKDDTTSLIPESLFDQFEAIDAEQSMLKYADTQPFMLVTASKDMAVKGAVYDRIRAKPGIQYIEILGADHNFSGPNRKPLLETITGYLQS